MACCCGYLVDGHCLVVSHFQVLFLGVAELCPEFLSGVEHFLHFERCAGFGAAGEVVAVEGGGEDFLLAVVADADGLGDFDGEGFEVSHLVAGVKEKPKFCEGFLDYVFGFGGAA